jgi:hypothetical protein
MPKELCITLASSRSAQEMADAVDLLAQQAVGNSRVHKFENIGEEEDDKKTENIGEEKDDPTTENIGEEEDDPKIENIGEEEDDPKTENIGEEEDKDGLAQRLGALWSTNDAEPFGEGQ